MKTKFDSLSETRIGYFARGLSPSTRAALALALPFTLVDSLHYLTAGTAMAFSLPVLLLIYLGCGMLAGLFARSGGGAGAANGAWAGAKLWLISTLVNTFVGLLAGVVSLGATLLLGVPYLLLCAPVSLALGALAGAAGEALFGWFWRRSQPPA